MHEYCLSPKSDEEEQIQNSHALYGRKIGYAYTVLVAVSDVLYLIVIEHSCGLFVALRYNNEWYSMPIIARKLLIMIMMRSEKPLGLRMGITYVIVILYATTVFVTKISHVLLAVSDVLYLIVIEHSCGLFVALRYNTEWYSMPIAARKLLIMIMMRSEKPLGLRMGKIVVLSYITFNTVLRTSSSYFMLLRSL
ncbi:odorant receptor 49b [Mycetomoellerius zeteki]|uniref:odorant receptor 49b n=1 Tax=Mycetomoellerius zeteki TaxID=64791 RepID=UPI00084E7EB3|nr:PREDICTED: odorant receptor 49b-like [Trachymyrmex zeteki]